MTKLPIVKSRDLIKYLNSKGFVCTHVRGSHHVFRSQTSGSLCPSYYKLNDGTIICAIVAIHTLVPDPKNPDGFGVNSTNVIHAFTPKEKRKPTAFQHYTPQQLTEGIIDDDVEYEVLHENFSVYDLSNGLTLSVKTVVGQIKKTKFFTRDGEPVYVVNTNPIIKTKKK